MKKIILVIVVAMSAVAANAQKFALLDMEYILKNIPAYERANEQLNQVSKKWQAEVEAINTEAQTMYKNYQNEAAFLSKEQKQARQEAIVKKAQVFRSGRRALQEAHKPHVAHTGRDIQCGEGHCRHAWLPARSRPGKRHWHHLRQPEDRHLRRGSQQAGLQIDILIINYFIQQ